MESQLAEDRLGHFRGCPEHPAQFAFINGLRPYASLAADGRGIRIGTLADLEFKEAIAEAHGRYRSHNDERYR
jgi:hypothetical protein